MEKKKKQYGIFAVIFKLGTKFASILTKILKSAKVVKVGLAAVSLVSYSYLFSWQFAIIIMSMLFIHESGHVWAMKRRGIA